MSKPVGLAIALSLACGLSLSACSRTLSNGGMQPPTGVTATPGDGQVALTWNGVAQATSYSVYMASQSGVTKQNYAGLPDGVRQSGIVTPAYQQTGLTNGKTYYFVVTGVKGDGESAESAEVSAMPTAPSVTVGTEFPLATTTGREMSLGAAFDGTNFLIGIQGDADWHSAITAQLASAATGALVGPRISVDQPAGSGGAPTAAFDGTNFLLIWGGDTAPWQDHVVGQFISRTGQLVGSPFGIDGSAGAPDVHGSAPVVVFDGTNYFVAWDQVPTGDSCNDEYGQFVTTSGTLLGAPIKINTTPCGGGGAALAFDGANVLVIWGSEWNAEGTQSVCWGGSNCDTANVWGQFVSKSSGAAAGATSGSNFLIHGASVLVYFPMPVFDGSNYLVVFSQETTRPDACPSDGCKWDIYGQFVTSAGAPTGSAIHISSSPTNHFFGIPAWNGTNYLVTWTEGWGTTAVSTSGVVLDQAGGVVIPEATLFSTGSDGRIPWAVVPVADGKNYFAVVNRGRPGADLTDMDTFSDSDVYGALLTLQ